MHATTTLEEIAAHASELPYMNIDDTVKFIRTALKIRTGRSWSVTRGTGTGYGWIKIAPPAKRCDGFNVNEEDRATLEAILGHAARGGKYTVPDDNKYYLATVQQICNVEVTVDPQPYWD